MNQDNEYRGAIAGKKASGMRKIDQDDSGWEAFYQDDRTREKWVIDYPESGQHGGGPARFRRLTGENQSVTLKPTT
jgi:hypothetical protein